MPETSTFSYPFSFAPTPTETIAGTVTLSAVKHDGNTLTRSAVVQSGTAEVAVELYSNTPSTAVLYLHQMKISPHHAKLLDISPKLVGTTMTLPGQLLLGGTRVGYFAEAVGGMLSTAYFRRLAKTYSQTEIVIVPVLREGVKYQIAEKMVEQFGYYCEEVVADAHHVLDDTVGGYGRRVDVTAFKDMDLTDAERQHIKCAIVGDSTASGIVVIGLLQKLTDRFPNLERVEVIAPLATLFACARIAQHVPAKLKLQLHAFETLLNSELPDFYWSPHFTQLELHMNPALQSAYRKWWGQDAQGLWVADTACAGYGWSEAFFHPQKFVRMMNGELQRRHNLTIAQIIARQK